MKNIYAVDRQLARPTREGGNRELGVHALALMLKDKHLLGLMRPRGAEKCMQGEPEGEGDCS